MIRPLAVSALALLLGACASSAPPKGATVPPEQFLPPPVPAKPVRKLGPESVEDRLDRLERSVAQLRIEISRLAPVHAQADALRLPAMLAHPEGGSYSIGRREDRGRRADGASPPGESQTILPVSTDPSADQFAVHLASYRDPALSAEGWRILRSRYGVVLDPLTPVQARVELAGKGVFYRLKAGPFPSWNAADGVCAVLRADGLECAVLDFSGTPLAVPEPEKTPAKDRQARGSLRLGR